MNRNLVKHQRMAMRRDAGNRKAKPGSIRSSAGPAYLVAHGCFACRKSFKITPRGKAAKCPQCGLALHALGRSFKAPGVRNVEQWLKVQALYEAGFRFFSYRSYPDAPKYPERLRDVPAFIAKNPRHPFRLRESDDA